MSAVDALAYIDKAVDNVEGLDVAWTNGEVMEMLGELRGMVADAVAELDGERAAEQFMAVLYTSALRHVEGERDRARAVAVRLEQDVALAATGIQRRAL